MKKFIKNNIIGFIIGAIIFTGVGVYAANISASNVTYEPDDETWDVNSVQSALDELYKKGTYISGTKSSSNYSNYDEIELGFEPSIILATVTTSYGYLRSEIYVKDVRNIEYVRSDNSMGKSEPSIVIPTQTGFNWKVADSTWGTQTIEYYAWK